MDRFVRLTAWVVVCVGAFSACSSDGEAGGTTTTATTAVVSTTSLSPTTSPSTTSPPPTSPPLTTSPPATTLESTTSTVSDTTIASTESTVLTPPEDEDWVAIMQALVNLRDELYATADPSRAGEFCAPGAFCYDQLVAQLTDAQSKGQRVVDQGPITIVTGQFEIKTDDSGFEIVIVQTDVRFSDQYGRIVDADGNTVYELVPEDPNAPREARIRWTLVRLDGGWRILDQVTL